MKHDPYHLRLLKPGDSVELSRVNYDRVQSRVGYLRRGLGINIRCVQVDGRLIVRRLA